jgi:hypothetical protein
LSTINKYIQAITYDYECNVLYHNLYDISSPIKYIPKVHYYRSITNKFNKFFVILYPFFILVYIFILYVPYILFNFFKFLIKTNFNYKKNITGSIYLDLSEPKYFSFINKKEVNYPNFILKFNNKSKSKRSLINKNDIYIEDLLNLKILTKSLIYSLISPFFIIFCKKRKLVLFSYTSFYWYLIYFTVDSMNINSIWLSNHYDRWTILATSFDLPVTLVQHGKLSHFDNISKKEYFHDFSFKIDNIVRVYSINTISNFYFKKYIKNDKVLFNKINLKLKILKWRKTKNNSLKILFVGNKVLESFHIKILNYLTHKYSSDIDIAYKYHPLQKSNLDLVKLWHIRDKNSLPYPNLTISYGSSLDDEIKELCDTAFFMYDDMSLEDIPVFFKKIDLKLKEFNISC